MLSFDEFYAKYRNDMPTLSVGNLAKIYTAYVKLDDEQKKYRSIIDEGHAIVDVATTKIGRRSVKLVTFGPEKGSVDYIDHPLTRIEYRTDLERCDVKNPY